FGRAGEHRRGPRGRVRGRRDSRARRSLAGAAAVRGRTHTWLRGQRRGTTRVLGALRRQVVAARSLELRRIAAQDKCRQVRQTRSAPHVRRGATRGADPMSESLTELADAVNSIERRVSDVIFDAVRAQLREDQADGARELERRLARVRRSLQKAEGLLRGYDGD